MKPTEGRKRVIIEEVQPTVDNGRYPAKRILGDTVTITAAIFGDGHDHLAARLLYHHHTQPKWSSAPFTELTNDLWSATFTAGSSDDATNLGLWHFTIEAWVDHFDTWVRDLAKRLEAQTNSAQDIPLALRIGANHLEATATRAKGTDTKKLTTAATALRSLADKNLPTYDNPITPELITLVAKYPDLSFATKHPTEFPLWIDRERARFSSWYELFPAPQVLTASTAPFAT